MRRIRVFGHAQQRHAQTVVVASLAAIVMALAGATSAGASTRTQRLCATPRPGYASCLAMRIVSSSLSEADLRASAVKQAREQAAGVRPAVTNKTPNLSYLTPQSLHSAYSLPSETAAASTQMIALVDAYNDPSAESDLAVYDQQFGLSPCTSANGCFDRINEQGRTNPLPKTQGGWATEISLDVQMAHAICQACHLLLVEASSESFSDLGAAVNAAVNAGATVVSNSYGGPEAAPYSSFNAPYDHQGVAITVSTGDCGYFNENCSMAQAANFPVGSPDVVAVGGTSLSHSGESWSSSAWSGGGSGCSQVFTADLWQSAAANYAATGCSGGRSVADVAAVGDPNTGVDVYDTTAQGNGDPTGWGVLGGTSAASPIVAGEFALAGGARGVAFPAATLYAHLGESSDLYDVASGSNGSCAGTTACRAATGFDGPSGVGSPVGLGAFAPVGSPTDVTLPAVSGVAEQGQTLSVAHGEWTNHPTSYSEQWMTCNSSGASCTAKSGTSGSTLTVPATAVGDTIRVQETAGNGAGNGLAVVSATSSAVVSNAPVIIGFTPTSGVTGSNVTITGSALDGVEQVKFGTRTAAFTAKSSTQVQATVPNGASVGKLSVTTAIKAATTEAVFTPTLSVTSVSPASAAPGKVVTISGLGFLPSSRVSIGGIGAASVTYSSATKLKATVPAGSGAGTVTVTNSSASPVGTAAGPASFVWK
jgi:subtilase family serine protease